MFCCSLVFLSWGPSNSNDTKSTETIAQISGKDMFRSIFLGEGSFGDQLNDIDPEKDLITGKVQDAVKSEVNRSIIILQSQHPGYFIEFKRTMESGSHKEVYQALVDAQKMIRAIIKEPKPSLDNNKMKDNGVAIIIPDCIYVLCDSTGLIKTNVFSEGYRPMQLEQIAQKIIKSRML